MGVMTLLTTSSVLKHRTKGIVRRLKTEEGRMTQFSTSRNKPC